MDIVNYPETPESQIAANQTADPPNAAGYQTKSCPLCGTLNHSLSRECFNCGWRGGLCGTAATDGRDPVFDRTALLEASSLGAKWLALKNWLLFIGSHRYGDTLK